jgi:hypothetical protein
MVSDTTITANQILQTHLPMPIECLRNIEKRVLPLVAWLNTKMPPTTTASTIKRIAKTDERRNLLKVLEPITLAIGHQMILLVVAVACFKNIENADVL